MATEHLDRALSVAAALSETYGLEPCDQWIARRVALAVVRDLERADAFRQVQMTLVPSARVFHII